MASPKKTHKVCPRCHRDLPRSDYRERAYRGKDRARHSVGALQISWLCRECERADKKVHRKPRPRKPEAPARVCEICRRTFQPPKSKPLASRCSAGCRAYYDIRAMNIHCRDCGARLTSGRAQEYRCRNCQEEHKREFDRERMRQKREALKVEAPLLYALEVVRLKKYWATMRKNNYAEYSRKKVAKARRHEHKHRGLVHDLTNAQWRATIGVFRGVCVYCGQPWEHQDHVVPISLGGGFTLGNIVPACGPCNISKGAKDVRSWLSATLEPRDAEDRYEALMCSLGDAEYLCQQAT